eukprot:CAMPEP_0119556102 /NCGR_PEP_ID=MMETSP1352-20130426/8146_1 /TAXON_ID=265584 /ORGANISM="Stauroneis constricta, Strain CCMP1120" /LENGTH=55 /DNA_ID=CAMNT_0007603001 /DNA_START=24 /DNA_END=188 /DNA_ORIENTATION=+
MTSRGNRKKERSNAASRRKLKTTATKPKGVSSRKLFTVLLTVAYAVMLGNMYIAV